MPVECATVPRLSRRKRLDLLAVGFLTIVCAVMFADVLFGQRDFFIRDLARYYHPTKSILRDIVLSGEFPWWNPYYSAGQPMAANPEYEVFYPFQWLILMADFETGYRLHILFHVWLAAVGMYLLLRSMRRSHVASLFGAIAWGYGGLTLSLINLLPILFAAAWLPLVLLFARRAFRRFRPRDAALASLFGGLQILVGEPTTLVQTWLIIGFYALWRMVRLRRRGLRAFVDPAAILLLVFVWSIGIGAVQLIPAMDHAADTSRSRGFDFDLVTAWSFPPQRVAELVYPHVFGRMDADGRTLWWGGRGLYGRPASPFFFSLHLGATMFALIGAGVMTRRSGRLRLLLFAAPFLLLALGRHTPLYEWGIEAGLSVPFRYPEKFILSVLFGAVLFGALLFDRIRSGDRRLARKAAVLSGVAGVIAAAVALSSFSSLYESAFTGLWGTGSSRFKEQMLTVSSQDWAFAAVVNLAIAIVFWLRSRATTRVPWAPVTVAILLIELIPVGLDASPRIQRSFYDPPEIVSDLDLDREDFRVFHEVDWYGRSKTANRWFSTGRGVYWVVRNGLYPMTPGNHGIRTVLERDYDRTALLPTVDLVRAMWDVRDAGQKKWASIFMEMSNVGYRARYRDFDEEIRRIDDLREIRPIELREVPLSPRYYLAEHLVEIEGKEEFVEHLVREVPEPNTAFVHFESFEPAGGHVSVIDETTSTIDLEVSSEGESFLVLSVTPHKYWQAEVDGEKATLETANIGYQGLRLQQGTHEVVLRYRNPVVLGTAPVSAVGLLAALIVLGSAGRGADFRRFRSRGSSEPAANAEGVGEHTGRIAAD